MPDGPRTLADALTRAADTHDEGLRLLDRQGNASWFSWHAVHRRAANAAGRLQAAGIAAGDRVALVYPTCPAFFDACFGILLAGAVPVPLYPPVRLGRLEEYHAATARMIVTAGARLVLADPFVRRVLGRTIELARPPFGCRALDDLPAGDFSPARPAESDLGLVQFSSGTTSEPHGAALTHEALVAQATMLNGFWPPTEGVRDEGLSWLPLYHDMGLIGGVFTALVRPGTLTVMPPEAFIAKPASWLQAISRHRATISPAPNFAYSLCVERVHDDEMQGVDLSSWRVALNGAEQAVPEVMRAFTRRFSRWGLPPAALTPVYGLSEASLAVTFSSLAQPFVSRRFDRELLTAAATARESADGREIASVGRPVPGVSIRIVDGGNRPLSEAHVGVVQCRGPSLMREYIGQPDATARVIREGWLDTGDLGFVWNGDLFLTGRAKDMLLVRGRNHAPEDVEQVVESVPGIRRGCVIAATWMPEGEAGERLLVLAEAQRTLDASRFEPTARACREAVVAALGLHPDAVVILAPGTLPRTSSGKLRRQEACARHLGGTLTAPARVTRLSLAAAVARSSIAFLRLGFRRRRGRGGPGGSW